MLKPLCKTPGQGSAAFGRTARNRLSAPFAPSKLPSDRGFDQKRPFFRIWPPSDEGFDHFRRAPGASAGGFSIFGGRHDERSSVSGRAAGGAPKGRRPLRCSKRRPVRAASSHALAASALLMRIPSESSSWLSERTLQSPRPPQGSTDGCGKRKEPRRALSEVGRARSIRARQTSGIRRSSYVGAALSVIYTDSPRCGKSYLVFTAFLADQPE